MERNAQHTRVGDDSGQLADSVCDVEARLGSQVLGAQDVHDDMCRVCIRPEVSVELWRRWDDDEQA